MKQIILLALTAATGLGLSLSRARADLLFSESFEYPTGPLNGDGPPPDSPPGQSGWTTDRGSTNGGFQMDEVRVGTTFADIRTGN